MDFTLYKSYFEKGEFEKALSSLNDIKNSTDSGLWNYNVAVTYQKLNNNLMARFHFEKSKSLGVDSSEISSNLKVIKDKLGVTSIEKPDSINDYIYSSSLMFNSEYIIAITLLLVVLVWFFIKRLKILIQVPVYILILTIGTSFIYLVSTKKQIIATDKIEIRIGPSKIFDIVQNSPKGMKLTIEKHNDKWVRVVAPEKFQGWIKNKGYKSL